MEYTRWMEWSSARLQIAHCNHCNLYRCHRFREKKYSIWFYSKIRIKRVAVITSETILYERYSGHFVVFSWAAIFFLNTDIQCQNEAIANTIYSKKKHYNRGKHIAFDWAPVRVLLLVLFFFFIHFLFRVLSIVKMNENNARETTLYIFVHL